MLRGNPFGLDGMRGTGRAAGRRDLAPRQQQQPAPRGRQQPQQQQPRQSPGGGKQRRAPRTQGISQPSAAAAAAAPPAAAAAAAVPTPSFVPAPLQRQMSDVSHTTLDQLDALEAKLAALELVPETCAPQIAAATTSPATTSTPAEQAAADADAIATLGAMRTELSQVHGRNATLLCSGIDSILINELHSGKDAAKAKRKELTARAMRLSDVVEALIKTIDNKLGVLRERQHEQQAVAAAAMEAAAPTPSPAAKRKSKPRDKR